MAKLFDAFSLRGAALGVTDEAYVAEYRRAHGR